MRLVSAIYDDFYPFDGLWPKAKKHDTQDPSDLKVGDVLIVWGGEDIHPSLYGHGRSSMSHARHEIGDRCEIEWALMNRAKELKLPIIGVCRGAQMLCALAGGTLIQHVNGHAGRSHLVNTIDNQVLQVNSIHHQMMNPTGTKHTVVAATMSPISDCYNYMDGIHEIDEPTLFDNEPEFVHFHDVDGYAIQWHPEMMHEEAKATEYVAKYIEARVALR